MTHDIDHGQVLEALATARWIETYVRENGFQEWEKARVQRMRALLDKLDVEYRADPEVH